MELLPSLFQKLFRHVPAPFLARKFRPFEKLALELAVAGDEFLIFSGDFFGCDAGVETYTTRGKTKKARVPMGAYR
jgi:hypothetical protein